MSLMSLLLDRIDCSVSKSYKPAVQMQRNPTFTVFAAVALVLVDITLKLVNRFIETADRHPIEFVS